MILEPEEVTTAVLKLYEQGNSVHNIASRVKLPYVLVRDVLIEHGLVAKRPYKYQLDPSRYPAGRCGGVSISLNTEIIKS